MPTPGISPLLGIGLAVSNVPQASTEGKQAGEVQYDAQQAREQRRKDARTKNKLMELKLAEAGRADALSSTTQPLKEQVLTAQLQQQSVELKSLKNKTIRNDSYKAFENYFDGNGDPKALNLFLNDYKTDPVVRTLFNDTVRVDSINPQNSEDQNLLLQAGLDKAELDALDGSKDGKVDWSILSKRYVKAIDSSGNTQLVDMLATATSAGYSKYADQERLNRLKMLADINRKQQGSSSSDTALVKNAQAVAAAKERIAAGKGTTADQELVRFGAKEVAGTKAGTEFAVNEARQAWQVKGFDKLSQKELQTNPEARRLVNQIELAHGLSNAVQKELLDLNSMVQLSSEAGQLSSEQTGLWDRMTSNISSYVKNEVGSKQAKASYGAFINQFRHNLFGSALTEGELKAFKEAYGDLGQQTGPVLAGLRAALIQVKSKLETISNLNDPIVIKFRTGKSIEEVQASLEAIDKRIQLFDLVSQGLTPDEAMKQLDTTQTMEPQQEPVNKQTTNRPSLDSIFGVGS